MAGVRDAWHSCVMIRISLAALLFLSGTAVANPPQVVAADAQSNGDTWTISVTLSHPDSGWDHYASGWEVLAPDGTKLGYRELTHPHVDEQPFTRSLSGVRIPEGIGHILIRPRCTLDGWVATPTMLSLKR